MITWPAVYRERRPYHALARENAEALNVLLTHEIPVMTQQLQQTMELVNQSIAYNHLKYIKTVNVSFGSVEHILASLRSTTRSA